jgi:predicted transcriptional regulator of viral defense system
MVKKLNLPTIERELKKRGIKIFTPLEFKRIFDISEYSARMFLHRHTKKGYIIKLRAGIYALADNFPSEFEIANRLYQPSYLSLEFALAHFGIIPEAIYTITSVTTKATRKFKTLDLVFTYRKIKKQAFSGYRPEKINGSVILIAEPEKALVDYLYFIDLEKREPNERIDLKKLSKKKVFQYASLFKRKSLDKLIKKVYAKSRKPQRIH